MLEPVYVAVSAVLWGWHQLLGLVLGHDTFAGWAFAVVLLVVTVRALLLRPALGQARFLNRMQRLAPKLQEIRRVHAGDRERQAAATSELMRENRMRPLLGYLPILVQLPVFVGLGHVLRAFTTPHTRTYVFGAADVHSYLAAHVLGGHLGDALVQVPFLTGGSVTHVTWLWSVAPLAVPLVLVAALATHLTARLTPVPPAGATGTGGSDVAGAGVAATAGLQVALLSRYVVPVVMLVFGAALPMGLLVYWVTSAVWTLGQQRWIRARLAHDTATGDGKSGAGDDPAGDGPPRRLVTRRVNRPAARRTPRTGTGSATGPVTGTGTGSRSRRAAGPAAGPAPRRAPRAASQPAVTDRARKARPGRTER